MSTAHYFIRHIYPALKDKEKNVKYELHVIDQSTHFWWHISAPRAIVSTKLMPHNTTFFPLEDGFKQYGENKDIITFHQAQPVSVNTEQRTVTLKDVNEDENADANNPATVQSILYHALIIATGAATPSPITSFHGDHTKSQRALDDINGRLAKTQSVVIAGGGPVAVETAGEVGEALNGTGTNPKDAKVKINIVTGAPKLLPVLGDKLAKKAEKFLNNVGVTVNYNSKVTKVDFGANEAGKTTVYLESGESLTADVYIPATGAKPNTDYLPKALLNDAGYVESDAGTLRVSKAGERVYVVGDVGAYTRGGVMDCYAAVPVLGNNLAVDLGVRIGEKKHKADESETQIVPVGSKQGLGAFKGFGMPGFVIKQMKGKDYMLGWNKKATWG